MKKIKIFNSILIILFLITFFLNLDISIGNKNKLNLFELKGLSNIAVAQLEGGDRYYYDVTIYESCCLDCWTDPLGSFQVVCMCEELQYHCIADPSGTVIYCSDFKVYIPSNDCTPTGNDC